MSTGKITTSLFVLAGIAGIIISSNNKSDFAAAIAPASEQQSTLMPLNEKKIYGFPAEDYEVINKKIKSGQIFSTILKGQGFEDRYLTNLSQKYQDVFDVRRFKAGNDYTLLTRRGKTCYFVYELDDVNYVVYDFLLDSVYAAAKEVSFQKKTATGIIKSSLSKTFETSGLDQQLAMELSDIFAWVVDFYRLQEGDRFKVIYEERLVEGKAAGVHKVLSALFNHEGNDFYAFYFQPDLLTPAGYFDESANSLRKAFLKAPLKFSRISSKYSKSRFHPVLKKHRPHLGVDYAAPTGTPILSVGDGIVVEAQYNKNNGNYVKIRHNNTYSTQYLHMSKFATGIKSGTKVAQGQVIGYVGSTGLATGPHVCFRFWKHGAQVDPLKVAIPPSEPVEAKHLEEYNCEITGLKSELEGLKY